MSRPLVNYRPAWWAVGLGAAQLAYVVLAFAHLVNALNAL